MSLPVAVFGVKIDPLRMDQAVQQVLAWTRQPDGLCRYVVTPNVDHIVMLQHHRELQEAYCDAGLVLADGAPVLWAASCVGKRLPERVAGSDLVPALFSAVSPAQPLRIYLLGAGPGVAEKAAERIQRQWPGVEVVGTYSPPLGFEMQHGENANILARIAHVRPDLLVVGLGAPKQELWVHQHRSQIEAAAVLCVGATIDFLAGEKRRAPRWMRMVGLEWLHRVCSEPKRLARRYARDAWLFPQIVAREWWHATRTSGAPAMHQ
jgi:N-acetylglucosaminyldiphosphoundecaprenol N-acetyl-beta-D-mannosaminyltransferase